jgi:16S rRNA processing protein RimM
VAPVDPDSYIAIARIVRTRGNRGEVLADLYTDFPDRFESLREVWVELSGGVRLRMDIEEAWRHQGRVVLKFRRIDSISEAERLVGAWVQLPEGEAHPLPAGSYFDHELIGCTVRGCGDEILGEVKGILRIAGNHQLVVRGDRTEFLIPISAEICREISVDRKEIRVRLPEGLIDLNE